MKKQKNLRSLIAGIAVLALAAGSLGTATYAWFTRGTEATANGFEFTASAASGIQISTDAQTWKSNISAVDFDTASGPQAGNRINMNGMDPVSTIDPVTAGRFDFYEANSIDGGFNVTQNTEDYLVFDLYFWNQGSQDLTLSLTDASSVIDGLGDEGTSLAARVGFLIEGSDNTIAGAVAKAEGLYTYVWEPNSLERSLSAIGGGATNSAKYLYNGVYAESLVTVDGVDPYGHLEANGSYTSLVSTTNDIAIGDDATIATLPTATTGGQITKIKVFVWIEGQDIDCNNAISEGDVIVNLGFDSGDAGTLLAAKTIESLDTTGGLSTVTVSGTGRLSAEYTAYVFTEDTDLDNGLTFRLFITTGSATYTVADVTAIDLALEVGAGSNYIIVVTSYALGAVGNRAELGSITNTIT